MNNRKTEIETRLAAISIRTKQLFDFEIRNENYFDVSSIKAERNSLYLEAIDLEDELEALPIETNPNRFIKSSFILSLLWVSKFYRAMGNQRTTGINDRFVVSLGSKLGIDFDKNRSIPTRMALLSSLI